jgi:hypothetical protein
MTLSEKLGIRRRSVGEWILVAIGMSYCVTLLVECYQGGCSAAPRIDTCERAVHHDARAVGYQCCRETCGDAGVSGYLVTTDSHTCVCGNGSKP